MCGIVAAIAERDVAAILLSGLKRLEYRGYDSAGVATLGSSGQIHLERVKGKVNDLQEIINAESLQGNMGIAHTRWATHGKPVQHNAHPLLSGDKIAIVHNGIIENHQELRDELVEKGYQFDSETDSEIIVHLIHCFIAQGSDFLTSVREAVQRLEGAFAIAVLFADDPGKLIAVRQGSPIVIGLGNKENFIASDHQALFSLAKQFIYLDDGDIAEVQRDKIKIYDADNKLVERNVFTLTGEQDAADKKGYRHFMLKEIYEQPTAVCALLEGRLSRQRVLEETFGADASAIFDKVEHVQIIGCGTSYHAAMVTRYWLENLAGRACRVEVASEYRYRNTVVQPNTLLVIISQSGETADTLAVLRESKKQNFLARLAICNVPQSTIVRESDLTFMTRAGVEIGVASTKAFTTQLTALFMLTIVLGRRKNVSAEKEAEFVKHLRGLPHHIQEALDLDPVIKKIAERFADKQHALFLGRGTMYPIALEGALKLKEISYIHAEAYPAGELKHGPLALVDKDMPVITIAPNDELLAKLKTNIHEVRARGGELFVFAENATDVQIEDGLTIIPIPTVDCCIAPIVYTVPLQLLAYHVAVLKGTDVDQPRNLAKSVTVE